MTRRAGLPDHLRSELTLRARAGIGLDPDHPTRSGDTTRSAADACRYPPSAEMFLLVKKVLDYLHAHHATLVRVHQDPRRDNQPGQLVVMWQPNPTAEQVAAHFAVSASACGTPRLPAWLSLHPDDDFDLRWQPPY